jgi:hypothetical protein
MALMKRPEDLTANTSLDWRSTVGAYILDAK